MVLAFLLNATHPISPTKFTEYLHGKAINPNFVNNVTSVCESDF
jgi:hypothetical protein